MIKLGCFLQWLVNVLWLCFVLHTGVEEFFDIVGLYLCNVRCVLQKMVMIVPYGDILMFNDTIIITNCLCNDCYGNSCSNCPCHF